jgi:hypothetical protein
MHTALHSWLLLANGVSIPDVPAAGMEAGFGQIFFDALPYI